MLWNRGFGCSGRLLVGMFWFGTCEVHGDLCPLCLTTQVSIIRVYGEESRGRQPEELQSADQEEGKCFMLTVHFSSIPLVYYTMIP